MKTPNLIPASLALSAVLLSTGALSAAPTYIGDAAADGANISTTAAGTYALPVLTIVMQTVSETIYIPSEDQTLLLTEVNFLTALPEGIVGTVTPFVALYTSATSTTLGTDYTLLSIGDPITVTGTGLTVLHNEAFTVGGNNPTISVTAGQQIVAGFLGAGPTDGRSVVLRNTTSTGTISDYIFNGDSLTGQLVGDPLTADNSFGLNHTQSFNIGFEVGSLAPPIELGDIWFIGDSITQSNADGDANGSPRKSLYDLLEPEDINFTYTGHFIANVDGLPASGGTAVTNLYHYHSGISGSVIGDNFTTNRVNMTDNIDTGLNFWNTGRLAAVKPEIILIMLGTNDIVQGDSGNTFDLPNAPARLSALVDRIMIQSGVGTPAIFVSTIAPNRKSNNKIANVAAFNAALPDVVAAQRLAGRDIYLVDSFTPLDTNYATAMRSDDLHPNTTGNGIIGQVWFDAIMHRFNPEPGTNYADWQIENFGSTLATNSSQGDNPDGDLRDNSYEFAFGGNPNVADDQVREPVEFDGSTLRVSRREPVAAELIYTLEESSTLEALSWQDVTDSFIEVLSTNGEFESVDYTRAGGFIGIPRNFYRLTVEESP